MMILLRHGPPISTILFGKKFLASRSQPTTKEKTIKERKDDTIEDVNSIQNIQFYFYITCPYHEQKAIIIKDYIVVSFFLMLCSLLQMMVFFCLKLCIFVCRVLCFSKLPRY